ncbi:MAG: hypothetical protein QM692_08025 [Thermomicrobiales bacterium]
MRRRVRFGVSVCALGLAGAAFSAGHVAPVAAQSCDPAYINYCVPPVSEVGDLDCDYFYSQGISGIQLADPYNDPHGLDGWNYVDDGIGCEGGY